MRTLWSDTQNCSHNVCQKFRRIRRVSEICVISTYSNGAVQIRVGLELAEFKEKF